MLPRKNFVNLRAVMAILVLFQEFSGRFCLNFLTLNLSASQNIMHFVSAFSIMCAQGVRLRYRRGSKLWKNCTTYIKNIFENGWWRIHPLILPPRSAPGHKLQKPSKESGIFQSLGTINFVLFY